MRKVGSCLIGLVVILALTLGGVLLGFQAGSGSGNASAVRWEQIPEPPEKAVRIIEIGGQVDNQPGLRVESASGKQYERGGSLLAQWQESAFHKTSQRPECADIQSTLFDQLQGKIADCAFISQFEWTTEQYYVALMEDGSLWRWYYHRGLDTGFNSAVCGGAAGLAGGVLLIVLYRSSRKSSGPDF
jgi:hypothetical protein